MRKELLVMFIGSLVASLEGQLLLDMPILLKGHEIWYVSLPKL